MISQARAYRILTRLYPASFRSEYERDLVHAFVDLARGEGALSAWRRACVDLVVTVPRFHLEVLMHRSATTSTLTVIALVVALAGIAGAALGAIVGIPLVVIAAFIAMSQRTQLARSLDVITEHRTRALRRAGMLALVFFVAVATWMYHTDRYDSLGTITVLAHNIVGIVALVGTIAFGAGAVVDRSRSTTPPPQL